MRKCSPLSSLLSYMWECYFSCQASIVTCENVTSAVKHPESYMQGFFILLGFLPMANYMRFLHCSISCRRGKNRDCDYQLETFNFHSNAFLFLLYINVVSIAKIGGFVSLCPQLRDPEEPTGFVTYVRQCFGPQVLSCNAVKSRLQNCMQ